MNTNDLRIFEAVAEQGSFTKAAAKTFTVQSNVTARIKNLEVEFGAELFNRSSKKVELTAAGKVLMRYGKQVGRLLEEAKIEMNTSREVTGRLTIGCIETTMALKAPEIILRFSQTHPGVDLNFRSANRLDLINEVLNYKLDAAFITAPISTPNLQQLVIRNERLSLLTPTKCSSIDQALDTNPVKIVVFDSGCIFRSTLEYFLSNKGIVNYSCITVNSLEGIINFVEAGLGISVLPEDLFQEYYGKRQINSFLLNKEIGSMTTLLITRSETTPSPALAAFIDLYTT